MCYCCLGLRYHVTIAANAKWAWEVEEIRTYGKILRTAVSYYGPINVG